MLQTLLIPIDFTIHTARALNYAIQVAQRSNACITVLSSDHRQSETEDNLLHLLNVADELAHHHFSDIVQQIHSKESLAGIRAMYHYLPNITSEAIIEEVNKQHFDLLVVSAKKKGWFSELSAGNFLKDTIRHLFFGTTLENLIATALPCPLLIVPETCRYTNIERVMYATNLSANERTLQKLQGFTHAIGAFTNFVHVVIEETRSHNKRLAGFSQRADAILGKEQYDLVEINHSNVDDALSEYLKQHPETNLVAMVERTNKDRLDRWLLNSVTRRLAYKSPVPVLLLHDTDDEL